jgi:phage-related protein
VRTVAERADGADGGRTVRAPAVPDSVARAKAGSEPVVGAPSRRTLTPRGVLRLQRTAGNAAVARLVSRARRPIMRTPTRAPTPTGTSASGGSLRQAGPGGLGPSTPPIAGVGTNPLVQAATRTSVRGELSLGADRDALTHNATADPALVVGAAPMLQRLATGNFPSPPPAPTGLAPTDDPRFARVASKVAGTSKTLRAHPPARGEAKKAGAAAVAPPGHKEAQAKAAQADKMSGAKPAGFDKAAFMAAVRAAIASKAPKNLDEADSFATSGKADSVKAEVMDKVAKGKDASAKDIASKTREAPDESKAKDKPVTPLTEKPPPAPPAPPTRAAMSAPAPAEQTDLRAGKAETDAQMADANVTEDQLARSNEPEFTGALAAKKEGEAHSATAPGQVRESEAATLQAAAAGADQSGTAAVGSMIQTRAGVQSQVAAGKGGAKSAAETARAKVTAEIKRIFDATKADVDKMLGDLDAAVDAKFTAGEAAAKAAFTADHKARMERYKNARYSGWRGRLRWLKDKVAGMPAEANNIFLESKKLYESKMDQVISDVADHIGKELTRAKDRIAKGRQDIAKFVSSQPKELQKVAKNAAREIGSQFDELESDVDSKQESLVDDLATRYSEARNAVDEEIKELQDANKGLWDKAKDAVFGAIQTILKLKNMLMGVLARAAGAIGKIIKDPIGFLGRLISAVKGGVLGFRDRIVDHLGAALRDWLFGSLASAGIEIPDSLDLKGIIKLVLSVLGLTWTRIRNKIVQRIGQPAMAAVEKGSDVFKTLDAEGVGGLWRFLVDKLSDLKDRVMADIQDFVVVRVIKSGITWLLSALNPAAAFIKACKLIYDVVMFFVEKGSQIKEFVDSVLDSVEEIAGGAVGRVAGLIEKTLAKILPLLIGFLASVLNLGGITEKIKEILQKVQKPVEKAVDAVINGALELARPIINLAKRGAAWAKGKYEKGKAWVKGKVGAAADWIKGAVRGAKSQRDFKLGDESHTLYAEPTRDGDGLQVHMASKTKAPLPKAIDKIEEAIGRLAGGVARVPSDAIARMRGAVRGAKSKGQQLEQSLQAYIAARRQERAPPDPSVAPTLKQRVDAGLQDIAAGLIPVGLLTKTQSHVAEKLKTLPREAFRAKLYNAAPEGSRWRSVRVKILRRDLPDHLRRIFQILDPWRAFKKKVYSTGVLTETQAADLATRRETVRNRLAKLAFGRKSYLDKEFVQAFDAEGDISNDHLRRSDLWDVDHRVPLAAHWNSIGFNTNDAVRFADAVDESNLELVSRSENRGAGGEYRGDRYDYSKPPGPNFDTTADLD